MLYVLEFVMALQFYIESEQIDEISNKIWNTISWNATSN